MSAEPGAGESPTVPTLEFWTEQPLSLELLDPLHAMQSGGPGGGAGLPEWLAQAAGDAPPPLPHGNGDQLHHQQQLLHAHALAHQQLQLAQPQLMHASPHPQQLMGLAPQHGGEVVRGMAGSSEPRAGGFCWPCMRSGFASCLGGAYG